MTERRDGKGVVVTGGDVGDIGREARDWSGLVRVEAQAHLGSGQTQCTLGSIPEAHHRGLGGHPPPGQPGQEIPLRPSLES